MIFLSCLHPQPLVHEGATVFAYPVQDPERYGVVEFDKQGTCDLNRGKAQAAEIALRRDRAYIFMMRMSGGICPFHPAIRQRRTEITDVNRCYLTRGTLPRAVVLGRGMAWLDTGTHDSLIEAAMYVQTIQKQQRV